MMGKIFFILLCGLLELFADNVCFAAQFRRAWVVEWQGQRSVLLGTDHVVQFNEIDVPSGMLNELRRSSQVFLETFPLPSPDQENKPLNWSERRLPMHFGLLLDLKAPAIVALKNIFPVMTDFERWATAKPGATYFAARKETIRRMHTIRDSYAHSLQAVMQNRLDRSFLDKNFEPFVMDSTLVNEVYRHFGKTELPGLLEAIAEHPRPAAEFKGVDWLIERWALANAKPLHGLAEFEPLPRGERLYIQLIEAGDLDQALREMEARLSPRLGAIYYYDSIIRGAVLERWSAENYFADLSAQDYSRKYRTLSPASVAMLPTIQVVEDYDILRHRYWFKGLKEMAKQEPLFIAVGLEHLINHPNGTPSLPALFKRAGFQVHRWPDCDSRLGI